MGLAASRSFHYIHFCSCDVQPVKLSCHAQCAVYSLPLGCVSRTLKGHHCLRNKEILKSSTQTGYSRIQTATLGNTHRTASPVRCAPRGDIKTRRSNATASSVLLASRPQHRQARACTTRARTATTIARLGMPRTYAAGATTVRCHPVQSVLAAATRSRGA